MMLFDVKVCCQAKMAATDRKWTGNYVCLSSCMIATKLQQLYPCFRGQATRRDYWECSPMSRRVGNQRWRPLTGSRQEITYISARIHDSNVIPTATPMFSGSCNTDRLLHGNTVLCLGVLEIEDGGH